MNDLSEAFMLIAELAATQHGTPLNGVFEVAIDENWKATLNATREKSGRIPPYSATVDWCGWPAGIIDPSGGVIAAGSAANEDTLCEALKAAMERGAA